MNLPITYSESGAGLVPAAVAQELMGMGGAFLLMFQLWMAVTAAGSAEQIAVSTLVAYDIYRTYINKKATGKQIILVSRVMIMVYGILSGVLAIVLKEIGLNLGWVYLVGVPGGGVHQGMRQQQQQQQPSARQSSDSPELAPRKNAI